MKPRRYLEFAAWTLGAVLTATYAGSRWWYAQGRSEGVAAFEELRAQVGPVERSPAAAGSAAESVDTSMWSATRVARYREAVPAREVPLAVLRIPTVKLAVPVFAGTSEQNLNRGAGWIEGTARLGEPGNVGIAAHRDGFFRVLKDVQIGDLLFLERLTGTDTYRIESTRIVDPSEVSVLEPTPRNAVTLVTCYPFYFVGSAPQRFVVHASFVRTKKTPAGQKPAGVESRVASGR
jgi:sortase A